MNSRIPLYLIGTLMLLTSLPLAHAQEWDNNSDNFDPFSEPLSFDPVYSTPTAPTTSPSAPGMTPFIPTSGFIEFIGQSHIKGHSGSKLNIINAYLTLPLVNPQNATLWGWHLDVRANGRVTWLRTRGPNLIDESTLYTLGLQSSVYRQIGSKMQVILGATPQMSSDLDTFGSSSWYFGFYGGIGYNFSDNLRMTLGIAYMPRYYDNDFMLLWALNWKIAPTWEARVQSSRFSLVNTASQRFEWGPFFQWNSSIWTVKRKRQTQQFRMTNCIVGLGTQYNLTPNSGKHIMLTGDIGTTFYNTMRVRDKDGNHTLEKYRSNSGLYLRLGAEVRF